MSLPGIELKELDLEPSKKNGGISALEHSADASQATIGSSQAASAMVTAQNQQKTKKQMVMGRIQFLALCWTLFLAGWNDGSTGPLLPRIREIYHVGFTIVSLLFVLACVGFIAGALMNVPLSEKYEFGKVMVFGMVFDILACGFGSTYWSTSSSGAILQVIAYTLQAPALPFPGFVISFMIGGIGIAVQDAQANGYVASFNDSPESKMGMLHAAYGAGALVSPLVATQFAQTKHWSFHYLISLGLAISNVIVLVAVFRFKTQDECLAEIGQTATEHEDKTNTFLQILKHKHVHLLAFFILVYVGTEVTIGGWIVTFLQEQRGGGNSAGYVSAGFFGGLMFGRVALLWLNRAIGEHRVVFLYCLLAIGLELIVWLVPSFIADAVAVSIVGVLLGPVYPITINVASRVLPRWILTGSIGWIAGFGQAGSALFPFMTGALSSRFGTKSLQPLLVAMMGLMTLLWALVPRRLRKED